ncbi:MAG: hypothetical protein BYD32DRAFT_431876 [Podila humilis]|nr:MAG: hypothetical protein BYD32DRAFT_431876 [Podila humilis]
MDDYADAIKNKETTLRLALQNPNLQPLGSGTIQFLDTTRINGTDYRDVEHAQEVIKGMIKIRSFNLIVVLIGIQFRCIRNNADLRAKANVSQLSAETRIRFLGAMQSRKSTLIETIKKYTDPEYVVNEKNIGGRIFSHTKDTMITAIRTNLPSPSISSELGGLIESGSFIHGSQDDYIDELIDGTYYIWSKEGQFPPTLPST